MNKMSKQTVNEDNSSATKRILKNAAQWVLMDIPILGWGFAILFGWFDRKSRLEEKETKRDVT